MKIRVLIAGVVFLVCSALHAENPSPEPSFSLTNVSIGQLSSVIFSDALKVPFWLAPEVVADTRLTSLRSPTSGLTAFLVPFFSRLGYRYSIEKGVHSVIKALDEVPNAIKEEPKHVEIYRPRYRPAAYLNQILRPSFGGSVSTVLGLQGAEKPGAVAPLGSAAALIDTPTDVVVLRDTEQRLAEIRDVLKKLDVPLKDIDVQALVFEFTKSKGDGSALSVAGSILGGQLGVSLQGLNQGSSLSLKIDGLEVIASLLDLDSRYKLVSRPSIRVRSGSQSIITVGQDVPVVGSVVVPSAGAPVRSIEYKTAGTTMKITPTLRDSGVIDVDLVQTLSNAFVTDTGVNESPTISRREISSALSVNKNESVVVGGLIETKTNASSRGLWGFKFGNQSTVGEVEYLVFLNVKESL